MKKWLMQKSILPIMSAKILFRLHQDPPQPLPVHKKREYGGFMVACPGPYRVKIKLNTWAAPDNKTI